MEAPGDRKGFLVASDTGATRYFVAVKKKGVCICQCKGFKTATLCSHSLAVADHVAKLHEYLSWFHSRGGPNITAAASTAAPKNAGEKPGKSLAFGEPGPSHHQEMMTATQICIPTWRLQVSKMSSDTTLTG